MPETPIYDQRRYAERLRQRGLDPDWPGHVWCDQIQEMRLRLGISVPQLARLVGVSERTVRRWVNHSGVIPTIRVRRRLRALIDRSRRIDMRGRKRRPDFSV